MFVLQQHIMPALECVKLNKKMTSARILSFTCSLFLSQLLEYMTHAHTCL